MRCMLRIQIDTEAGNAAIKDGSLPNVIQQVMEKAKPEASYFTTEDGDRTSYMFFDLADPSDIPMIAEPAFMNLNAKVTFAPVMNLEDLQTGLAKLG